MTFSALVLTLNEEKNISRCLESLVWCDEIYVLDSFSSDRTVDIAESMGAFIVRREFDNYANQRNYGINEINYKNNWLVMIDADEVVTPELKEEIIALSKNGELSQYSLLRVRRRDFFCGKWIKHSSGYPTWFGRVMKIGEVSVEREINEEYVTSGKVGLLNGHLEHYPFNKGFDWWLEKHNRYSSMEALKLAEKSPLSQVQISDLFSRDPSDRRRIQKCLIYSAPFRPMVVFLIFYIARLGFLDGRAGLKFSILRAIYEYQISCKLFELKRRKYGLPL